ncbi:MAG: hypothetical protein NTX46_02255, partial [Chloroflexi bacterium]|nr:hypothetical protein [Chloroflexota bacterium]
FRKVMMTKHDLWRIILVVVCVAAVVAMSLPVLAVTPHEDPDTAVTVYDGISLFRYYSETWEFVLAKNYEAVQANIQKVSFANLPETLTDTTDHLMSSILEVAQLIVEIDGDMSDLNLLLQQSRFTEVASLSTETIQKVATTKTVLGQAESDTVVTGAAFGVSSASAGSSLRAAYDDVLDRITKIENLLGTYENILASINTSQPLIPTEVTLSAAPGVVFVGDDIVVSGILKSEGGFLAGREVAILINNSQCLTTKTDVNGYYRATLAVPYWYVAEMKIQALYYPQDADIGVYLASLSPEVKLNVLFYEANLTIELAPKAYPGLKTTVSGKFDYGESAASTLREVEVYLDNALVAESTATGDFSLETKLDAGLVIGEHTVTVSLPATGRYASVVASAVLNVAKAVPVLTINFPTSVMIPGRVELRGKIQSEIGPLQNADISIGLDKARVEVKSKDDGTFDVSLKMSMGFELVGSQPLVVQVVPQEPWNDVLTVSRKVLLVNVINCTVFLAIIVFFGVFLSRRLRARIEAYAEKRRTRPVALPVDRQEPAPVYSEVIAVPPLLAEAEGEGEPQSRVFSWYISILKLVQRVAKVLLRPNQTLREFAADTQKSLGPVAGYFLEFTKMIERLLYSRYQTTDKEVEVSRRLTSEIEEGLRKG